MVESVTSGPTLSDGQSTIIYDSPTEPKVFYTELAMPTHTSRAHKSMLAVAANASSKGYIFIDMDYRITDLARNTAMRVLWKNACNPDSMLVMLDSDHAHPADIVWRLARHNVDIVGALAFKRVGRPLPCWFVKVPMPDGTTTLQHPPVLDSLTGGLHRCAIVGTGAICIKRKVMDKLNAAGAVWPYFRLWYPPNYCGLENIDNPNPWPGEDLFFGLTCDQAGVETYVDLDTVTPHIAEGKAIALDDYKVDYAKEIEAAQKQTKKMARKESKKAAESVLPHTHRRSRAK